MRYVTRGVGVEDVFVSRVPVHIPAGDLDMDPEALALAIPGSSRFVVVKIRRQGLC